MENNINLDLSKYSFMDLFNILDITIDQNKPITHYNTEILTKIDNNIQKFKNINTDESNNLVKFFTNMKYVFFPSYMKNNYYDNNNITHSEQTVIYTDNKIEEEVTDSSLTTNKNYIKNNTFINPTIRKEVVELLNIDSKYRRFDNEVSPTSFYFDLPAIIKNVTEITLNDFELPNTYYPLALEYNNNYFWVKFTKLHIPTQEVLYEYFFVMIKDGSYYTFNMLKRIAEEFETKYGLVINISLNLDYDNEGTVAEGDGKVNIEYIRSTDVNVTREHRVTVEINFSSPPIPNTTGIMYQNYMYIKHFTNTEDLIEAEYLYNNEEHIDLSHKFGWLLGFRKPIYNITSKITSESVMNLLGPRYLFIVLNDFNNNNNNSFFSSSKYGILKDDIIARINISGSSFSITSDSTYSLTTIPRIYYGPINLEKLKITIYDEHERIINLNGADISFTLRIKTIYNNI